MQPQHRRQRPHQGAQVAKPKTERRERAQRFLKDALAHGPKQVSTIEEAAVRAHVDPQALEQARDNSVGLFLDLGASSVNRAMIPGRQVGAADAGPGTRLRMERLLISQLSASHRR
jgi:hypothetical protein